MLPGSSQLTTRRLSPFFACWKVSSFWSLNTQQKRLTSFVYEQARIHFDFTPAYAWLLGYFGKFKSIVMSVQALVPTLCLGSRPLRCLCGSLIHLLFVLREAHTHCNVAADFHLHFMRWGSQFTPICNVAAPFSSWILRTCKPIEPWDHETVRLPSTRRRLFPAFFESLICLCIMYVSTASSGSSCSLVCYSELPLRRLSFPQPLQILSLLLLSFFSDFQQTFDDCGRQVFVAINSQANLINANTLLFSKGDLITVRVTLCLGSLSMQMTFIHFAGIVSLRSCITYCVFTRAHPMFVCDPGPAGYVQPLKH